MTSGAVFVAFLWLIPKLVGTNLPNYTSTLILVILILSLGLLIRTSRQVSLCQYAFAAVGASSMAHFTSDGIPWLASLLLAALVVVPVGALIAIPAIRLSGVFLARRRSGVRNIPRADGVHPELDVRRETQTGCRRPARA